MENFDKAREVFNTILCKVYDSKFYESIEMVLLKKDELYADEIGIRVFVNSKQITNKDLEIPKCLGNTLILVEYKIVKSNFLIQYLN